MAYGYRHGSLAALLAAKLVQFWLWRTSTAGQGRKKKEEEDENRRSSDLQKDQSRQGYLGLRDGLQLWRLLSEPLYSSLLYRGLARLRVFRGYRSFGAVPGSGTKHKLHLLYVHTVLCMLVDRGVAACVASSAAPDHRVESRE
jgi:hypothetical protein